MTDEPENMTLRYMRCMDEKLDRLAEAVSDLASEVRGIKTHMAGFMQHEVASDSAVASIKDRLSRIERRLDLQE